MTLIAGYYQRKRNKRVVDIAAFMNIRHIYRKPWFTVLQHIHNHLISKYGTQLHSHIYPNMERSYTAIYIQTWNAQSSITTYEMHTTVPHMKQSNYTAIYIQIWNAQSSITTYEMHTTVPHMKQSNYTAIYIQIWNAQSSIKLTTYETHTTVPHMKQSNYTAIYIQIWNTQSSIKLTTYETHTTIPHKKHIYSHIHIWNLHTAICSKVTHTAKFSYKTHIHTWNMYTQAAEIRTNFLVATGPITAVVRWPDNFETVLLYGPSKYMVQTRWPVGRCSVRFRWSFSYSGSHGPPGH